MRDRYFYQKVHQYKNLKVWRRAMDLAEIIYSLTNHFPKEEKFGITAQIRRCVVSIPSNIAEGSGRNSPKQFKHFLEIAMGSCNELKTQVELAKRFKYLSELQANSVLDELNQIYRMIFSLFYKIHEEA